MKIAWFAAILTSGLINSTMATTATSGSLMTRSKKRQRSIICGPALKVSRKGFEFLVFFGIVYM